MKAYRGVINGKVQKIKGWNESGQLVLATGERFLVEPLGVAAEQLRSLTLHRIARLTFTGGEWLLDGQALVSLRRQLMLQPASSATDSLMFTYAKLGDALKESRPPEMNRRQPAAAELRARTVGVAWLVELREEYRGQELGPGLRPQNFSVPPATVYEPVLLAVWRSLGRVRRETKVKRAKAAARLRLDASVALVPDGQGGAKELAIGQYLLMLLRTILNAGGRMARTALCQHREIGRPDKLLKSQTARALVRAGLLGRSGKTGSTVTYWVREEA